MLDGLPVGDLTERGLLLLAILMVFLGWLVPKRILDDKKEEAERWRKAYEAEKEARQLSDAQTRELLEEAKTTRNMVAAIFTVVSKINQSGEADVALPTK